MSLPNIFVIDLSTQKYENTQFEVPETIDLLKFINPIAETNIKLTKYDIFSVIVKDPIHYDEEGEEPLLCLIKKRIKPL